jgi:hypothetical protein
MLKRSDIAAEDGMHLGCSVVVKSVVPEKLTNPWLSVPRRHEYIPGVLRAGAPPADGAKSAKKAKQAKEPDPPADDKGKDAKDPDPPPDEPESDAAPRRMKRQGRPIPAWAPRGVPGAYFTAQLPREYDEDGKPIGAIEYQDVYWHQGM